MAPKFIQKLDQNQYLKKALIAVALLAVAFAGWNIWHLLNHESTDDAFVDGHVVQVSPKVSGHVDKVYVRDNQMVKAGDLLFEIDDRDYAARFDLAQANVKAALAEDAQARQDAERYQKLKETGDISQQEYDRAVTRLQTAAAHVDSAKALLKQAELNLSYTRIRAPEGGQVAKKNVEPGAFVQEGQVLFAIVPPERWVTANLKETQMEHIVPGLKVTLEVDAYPGRVFHGHVDSIQQGTGSKFSLLPVENATGNFIKVVQRVPVKIVFDEPLDPGHPLALGMSVIPSIDLKKSGSAYASSPVVDSQ